MYQGDEFIGALNLQTGQYTYSPYTLPPALVLILWLMIVPGAFVTFGITAAISVLMFLSAGRLASKRTEHVDNFVRQYRRSK